VCDTERDVSVDINARSYFVCHSQCELSNNLLGDTGEATNSPSQDGSHPKRKFEIRKSTALLQHQPVQCAKCGAFIQLLYISPSFTSLLLYTKHTTPFPFVLYSIIYYNSHIWDQYTFSLNVDN
jgi:hypothetical protein